MALPILESAVVTLFDEEDDVLALQLAVKQYSTHAKEDTPWAVLSLRVYRWNLPFSIELFRYCLRLRDVNEFTFPYLERFE